MVGLDATDGIAIVIGVIGVLVITASLYVRHREPDRPKRTNGWRSRAANVCAAGREVIDLTTAQSAVEEGSGLSVSQLSLIEAKLDLLTAQIGDVQATAPTAEDAEQMRLAALHAASLNEAVRTERRVRLKSVAATPDQFDTLGLQLASARSGLDDVLREISTETKQAP